MIAPDELTQALRQLGRGGMVAAATETWFGLLVDPFKGEALGRLFELKGRDAAKASALLLPNRAGWSDLVDEISEVAARLAESFWPGPLTIALKARSGLDPRIVQDGTVAVRVPGPSAAQAIGLAWGAALTATSANPAGAPACRESNQVQTQFGSEVAAGRLWVAPGVAPGGAPSTIVRVQGERVRIIRSGAIASHLITRALAGTPAVVEVPS